MTKVYYVKLGPQGRWEEESIKRGIVRIGWRGQSVADINAGRWDLILEQLKAEKRTASSTTNDFNRLREFAQSGPSDVWLTFHHAKLWWTRLFEGPVEQDETSKFRRSQPWSDTSQLGTTLFANAVPGALSALQGFRGTICSFANTELVDNVLTGQSSPFATMLAQAKTQLEEAVATAVTQLHWKDFETLVDLVFRATGWVRVSLLGEVAKSFDLVLQEPITAKQYVVQVKSRASRRDLVETLAGFSSGSFEKLFFVVHTPSEDLEGYSDEREDVDLVFPKRLGQLVVSAGLVGWLQSRIA